MKAAGFARVEFVGETGVATSRYTLGSTFRAQKPG
jgi:hypothetical protein